MGACEIFILSAHVYLQKINKEKGWKYVCAELELTAVELSGKDCIWKNSTN